MTLCCSFSKSNRDCWPLIDRTYLGNALPVNQSTGQKWPVISQPAHRAAFFAYSNTRDTTNVCRPVKYPLPYKNNTDQLWPPPVMRVPFASFGRIMAQPVHSWAMSPDFPPQVHVHFLWFFFLIPFLFFPPHHRRPLSPSSCSPRGDARGNPETRPPCEEEGGGSLLSPISATSQAGPIKPPSRRTNDKAQQVINQAASRSALLLGQPIGLPNLRQLILNAHQRTVHLLEIGTIAC